MAVVHVDVIFSVIELAKLMVGDGVPIRIPAGATLLDHGCTKDGSYVIKYSYDDGKPEPTITAVF